MSEVLESDHRQRAGQSVACHISADTALDHSKRLADGGEISGSGGWC